MANPVKKPTQTAKASVAAPATPATPVAAPVIEKAAPVVARVEAKAKAETNLVAEAFKPFADMQEKLRMGTEQGLNQFRSQYDAFKGKAETATNKLEASMQAAQAGTREFNAKVFDLFRAQANASLNHVQALFAVKDVAEAVKLQQSFVSAQMEDLKVQSQALADLAKKVTTEMVEPVKDSMVVSFKR